MKKLVLAVMLVVLVLCGCSSKNDGSNAQNSAKTAVSKGYSLDQLQLGFAGEKDNLLQQKNKYDSTVNVNGDYTEIYTNTSNGKVSVMKMQGFCRDDLKNAGIFINGRVYSERDLKDNIVYLDSTVVVLDISQMVYQDSLGKRVQNLKLDAEKESNLIQAYSGYTKNIGSLIFQGNQNTNNTQDTPKQPRIHQGVNL